MAKRKAAAVLDDVTANTAGDQDFEGYVGDDDEDGWDGPPVDDDEEESGPIDEQLKTKPVGELLSTIALQGVSSHAKKRPIAQLDDAWLRAAYARMTGLLTDQPDAAEAADWKYDVRLLTAAADARGLDVFETMSVAEQTFARADKAKSKLAGGKKTTVDPASTPMQTSAPVSELLPDGELKLLALDQVSESPWNPRKHFDPAKLQELAASIREHGILTPLLARPSRLVLNYGGPAPTKQVYELAAGHRRLRAAKLAGRPTVPVIVREMSDTQLLEVLTIENLQRDDVHPLEEAQGYHDLVHRASYTVQRIADRVGRSVKYVYDRMKLLALTKEAKALFLAGRFEAGHAILLARLSPDDQDRAIGDEGTRDYGQAHASSGLFEREQNHGLFTDDDERAAKKRGDQFQDVKTRSVRELEAWINRHVRLDPARDVDPMLFPAIAESVVPAAEQKRKVIPITHEYRVPDEARSEERTYGSEAWRRADGKPEDGKPSKTCEHSVMGFVAAGAGRGEAFLVCVNKQKCDVHWPHEARAFRAKEKAKKEATKKGGVSGKTADRVAKTEEAVVQKKSDWEIHEEKRKAEQKAFAPIAAASLSPLAAFLKKLPAGSKSRLAEFILENWQGGQLNDKDALKLVGRGTTGEDLIRCVAFHIIVETADAAAYSAHEDLPEHAEAIGFDWKKFAKSIAPKPEKAPAKVEKPKAAKKASAKKRR